MDMQAWRAETCLKHFDQLLLDVEHKHTHTANVSIWCAGERRMNCHVCHRHTVGVFIASTYSLTLTRLRCRETFLRQSVRYGGARSCCSSAISTQRTQALTCFTKKCTVNNQCRMNTFLKKKSFWKARLTLAAARVSGRSARIS